MLRVLIVSLALSFSAHASHLETVCKSMNGSPVFSEGVVARGAILETIDGAEIFRHTMRIRSVISFDGNFWLLTTDEILEVSNSGSVISRYEMDQNRSMILVGQQLMVIRGGGTLTAFDLITRTASWTSYMNEINDGDAVSAAFDGTNLLVTFTGNREGGFNGVATVSTADGSVIRKTPYDYTRAGVIDPDAKARWNNNQLILNNGGWIHVITKAQLASPKAIKPRWIAHAIGTGMDQHYMMLRGEFFLEQNVLVGCGVYTERRDGEFFRVGGLFKIAIP